jgi:hypothetical protein
LNGVGIELVRDESALLYNRTRAVGPALTGQFWDWLNQKPTPTKVSFKVSGIRLRKAIICSRLDEEATPESEMLRETHIQIVEAEGSFWTYSRPFQQRSNRRLKRCI